MQNKPFIKKFKVGEHYYIYDVNSNAFFKVDEPVYGLIDGDGSTLSPNLPGETVKTARDNIEMMKKKGFFSSRRPDVTFFHSSTRGDFAAALRQKLEHGLHRLTLAVSEACNLRCRYCSYSGAYRYHRVHSEKKMNGEIMKKAVDFYFAHSKETKDKKMSFYGGEPLTHFDLIKQCVEYVETKHNTRASYNMTVNGTLLDKNRISFLVEKDFALLVSLDGPQDIHDRNRVFKNGKGSFDAITKNLRYFKTAYPDFYRRNVRFNMVLNPPLDLEALDNFITRADIEPADVSFNIVDPKATTYFDQFTIEDMTTYGSGFITARDGFSKRLVNNETPRQVDKKLFGKRFVSLHQREMKQLGPKTPSHGQCLLGERSLLVNTSGHFNFCTQVTDSYDLGNVDGGFDYETIENIYYNLDDFLRETCRGCWAIRFCHKCIKDLNINGKPDEKTAALFCKQQRQTLQKEIIDYIAIREANPTALDYLENINVS